MTGFDDLAKMDATALAELVRKKEVKPSELVEAAIRRIEQVNPKLNAVVTPMYDQARAAAQGELGGPFAGVPFLLKDLMAEYAGVRTTSGARVLKDYVSGFDSEQVVRLKRAGLIVLGKTNTPELGLVATTEPQLFGPCRNPWNTGHSTGGSSGGSAAAVAAGIVPRAHANDGGGSIRIPASCCGVFGLKPTRARNSLAPLFGDMGGGMVIEHAVTRSVRDSAALLDATCGPALGDPYVAPPQGRPFVQEVETDPGTLRIAFTTQAVTGAPVHPDCVRAVQEAAKLCQSLGHEVTEAAPPFDGQMLLNPFVTIWRAICAFNLEALAFILGQPPTQDQVEPLTWFLYEQGRQVSAASYQMAWMQLQMITRQMAYFMIDYDVLLTPVLASPPPEIGYFDDSGGKVQQVWDRTEAYAPFTPICNATGQPAMSVPLYWTESGLPVGAHFIGRYGGEAVLFRLAAQLEKAKPWADRYPPVSVFSG
ncbi:MAG: amidase family protein [Pseudomonadota bacterium]